MVDITKPVTYNPKTFEIENVCGECSGYGYVMEDDNDIRCPSCKRRNEDPDAKGDQEREERDPNY